MDALFQFASTVVGQEQIPHIAESSEFAHLKAILGTNPNQAVHGHLGSVDNEVLAGFAGNGKSPGAPLRVTSVDSYSESNSTASSSSVNSSGCNSPVSTSTATSDFYFEGEVAFDDEDASELIRNFTSALHKDARCRPAYPRAASRDAHRRTSASDSSPMPKHMLPAREQSPGQPPHYTFPLRSVSGWSPVSKPTHSATAPVSPADSRRGSTHVQESTRPRSTLSVAEPFHGDYMSASVESYASHNTMVIDTPANIDANSADITQSEEPDHPIPTKPRVNHGQVEDICELVLKQAFNVDLQDLDFPSDALESVTHCLEELSAVVSSCPPVTLAAPVREVPAGNHHSETHSPTEQKSRGKKRANSRDNSKTRGDDDQHDAQSGDEDASPTSSKKVRIEPPDNRYSCPFRKRNPLKFNIRDYNTCATSSFSDFTNLKRHIKLYHGRQARLPYVCFRCGVNQETRDRLLAHVQQPPERMCTVRREAQQTDPEDGITRDVEELLNERKSKAKIDTWPGLWRALFGPLDDILPSEFVPPVEWDEVKNEFEITRDILKNRVQLESVTIKELRPEAQAYVAAHMDHTCWDYIHSVLSACRLQADYQSEKHHKRRRSQKSNITTQNSPADGLLPPLTQRHILPKPTAGSSGDGLPMGPNMAVIQSNGSSLSSSWETAISNISSSNLPSTSSSFSLTTPGEPQQSAGSAQSFVYLPAPDLALAQSIPDDDILCKDLGRGIASVDEFPSYGPDVDGGGFGLGGLFGYTDVYDGQDCGYSVYDGDGSGFDLGGPGQRQT